MKLQFPLFIIMAFTSTAVSKSVPEVSDSPYVRSESHWDVTVSEGQLSVIERTRYKLVESGMFEYNAEEYRALLFSQPILVLRDGKASCPVEPPSLAISVPIAVQSIAYYKHLPEKEGVGDAGYFSIMLKIGRVPPKTFDLTCTYAPHKVPDGCSLVWWPMLENTMFLPRDVFKAARYSLSIKTSQTVEVRQMESKYEDGIYHVTLTSPNGMLMMNGIEHK